MRRMLMVLAMGLAMWGGQPSGATAEEGEPPPVPIPQPIVLPLPGDLGGQPTCC